MAQLSADSERPRPATETAGPENVTGDLLRLLELETIEENLFRASHVFDEHFYLYGGQVAAQALRAAGLTVDGDRTPHSLHGYFLRPGDASRPTVFQVFRDRDGRSFSARRVVAVQGGKVIFNMAASFHVGEPGVDAQDATAPPVPRAAKCPPITIPRLFSFEGRALAQRHDLPTQFWARCTQDLGDDALLHACALTYLSDISTGLFDYVGAGWYPGPSLDHAVWFHRPARADDWILSDYQPRSATTGRGWYTGAFFDPAGRLVASVAQEALLRQS